MIYINGGKLYKGSWCINNVFYFSLPLVTCGLGFFYIFLDLSLFAAQSGRALSTSVFALDLGTGAIRLLGIFLSFLILRNFLFHFFRFKEGVGRVGAGAGAIWTWNCRWCLIRLIWHD